jgi:hypothetical protein
VTNDMRIAAWSCISGTGSIRRSNRAGAQPIDKLEYARSDKPYTQLVWIGQRYNDYADQYLHERRDCQRPLLGRGHVSDHFPAQAATAVTAPLSASAGISGYFLTI